MVLAIYSRARSVSSIITSSTQLYRGEVLPETPEEVDMVKNLSRGIGGGSEGVYIEEYGISRMHDIILITIQTKCFRQGISSYPAPAWSQGSFQGQFC
jgi:hypothetical protein